jgi:outer membrane biosynthesis protein TonB
MVAASLLFAVTALFTPPRLIGGDPPGLAPPNVVAGGEVLVEATVDKTGAVSRAILIRNTPPYGQMVLDAVKHWRFTPAHDLGEDGRDEAVESSVLIAAVYRSPTLMNGPTVGTAPVDVSRPSSAAPYPVVMSPPVHPIQAPSAGVVLLEVSLDEAGITRAIRTVRSNPGLDAAARDAVGKWNFRGASFRSRPVASRAYVIVGFPEPILNSPVQ